MRRTMLVVAVLAVQAQPAVADETKPNVKHPVLKRTWSVVTWPARKTWGTCVWIGNKTEPIHPFLNLLGCAGSVATPFAARFGRH